MTVERDAVPDLPAEHRRPESHGTSADFTFTELSPASSLDRAAAAFARATRSRPDVAQRCAQSNDSLHLQG